MAISFIEYLVKTTDLSQVTDKLYHIMLIEYTLSCTGFKLITLVVMGTDCTGSCNTKYQTIRTTTASMLNKYAGVTSVKALVLLLIYICSAAF
jgi:hypothetical protein